MDFNANIRVHTDERHKGLYNDLKKMAFGDMHELFFLCVCLGYSKQKIKPLGSFRDQRFWSGTITPYEYSCYYAMILAESDFHFASIIDDKNVLSTIEEYANAGMDILMEEFLDDYVSIQDDTPRLEMSRSKELPKLLLNYINENVEML